MAWGYIFGGGCVRKDEAEAKARSEGKSQAEVERAGQAAYDAHVESCKVGVDLHQKAVRGITKLLG